MSLPSDALGPYLKRLQRALGEIDAGEREEILSDIQALVRERVEGCGESMEVALSRLGPPEALADAYRVEGLLSQAAHGSSPLGLIRAASRWAVGGLMGFITAAVVFCGYVFGFAFMAVAIAKPFLPSRTGFWIDPDSVLYGIEVGPRSMDSEVLGYWIIPVSILLALLSFILTTRLARWIIRHRKPFLPLT